MQLCNLEALGTGNSIGEVSVEEARALLRARLYAVPGTRRRVGLFGAVQQVYFRGEAGQVPVASDKTNARLRGIPLLRQCTSDTMLRAYTCGSQESINNRVAAALRLAIFMWRDADPSRLVATAQYTGDPDDAPGLVQCHTEQELLAVTSGTAFIGTANESPSGANCTIMVAGDSPVGALTDFRDVAVSLTGSSTAHTEALGISHHQFDTTIDTAKLQGPREAARQLIRYAL